MTAVEQAAKRWGQLVRECAKLREDLFSGFFGQGGAEVALAGAATDGNDEFAFVFGRQATCNAAQTFAPVEMPAKIPSSGSNRRAV